MVVFGQTRGPMGGVMSSGRNPAVTSLLQNKETGRVKVNINLIKIIVGLNKVREEIKTLREIMRIFTRNL